MIPKLSFIIFIVISISDYCEQPQPVFEQMNIWLKTSGQRTSSRINTTLPTITQQRNHNNANEDSESDEDCLPGSRLRQLYQFSLSKGGYTFNGDSNIRQTEQDDHSFIERPRQTEQSRKSVRFSEDLQKSECQLKSRRIYQNLEQNEQDNTLSQVPTHYILDKDSRLKFKHIKKDVRSSEINRQSSDGPLKQDSSPFSFFGSGNSNPRGPSAQKKEKNNAILASSNSNSISNNVLPSSIRLKQSEFNKSFNRVKSTSRSNSLAVNVPSQRHEEQWSVPVSRRELSAGKTTGRNTIQEHIISIIQYCSNEVGMAVYNTSNGEIYLCQIIERLTYFRTISTMQRFYPLQIIYSASLQHTPLIKQLLLKFRNISFKHFKRIQFDQTKGYNIYSQRGNKDDYNPDNKFIAYSALNALIYYLENNYQTKFNYNSLNIKWHLIEDLLIIESQTISELEIFLNAETKTKQHCFVQNFQCLTYGGTRMLRANLLQPLANQKFISQRQQLLNILLQDKILYDILCSEIQKFKNFEIVTAKFIQSPKEKNMKSLKTFISAIYMLSHLSLLLRKFHQKIQPYIQQKLPLLAKLFTLLGNPKISELKDFIEEHFDEQVLRTFDSNRPTKRQNFIFLFKAEKIDDDFIDILRITYSHTTEDIFRIFKTIKEKSGVDLKLQNSEFRGYYIKSNKKINLSNLSQKIEDDIIQITEKKDCIIFSTTILLSLNNRLKQSEKKLIILCENLLQGIIFEIQKNIDVLFEINYEISVIDMVLSFAGFIKKYQGIKFTKPIISKNSGCFIVDSLKTVWTNQAKSKISNPVNLCISKEKKAVIIQKQANSFQQLNLLYSVGYLTILAQIGCFVPASAFTTDLYQTVMSKVHLSESIESNLSHFQTQLHHFKNIIDNSSHHNNNCLILLDQLIKGTQYEEEISLSQALITHLLGIKGKTFILISDRYQLSFMMKISRIPTLIDPTRYDVATLETIQSIKKTGKTSFGEQGRKQSPFHFQIIDSDQPLEEALKSLNFSPQFIKSFEGLVVREGRQRKYDRQ